MKLTILIIPFILILTDLFAQEKTFIREYSYKASDLDSKISSRAITVNQLQSMLLNEVGVYVESESILKTSEVGSEFSQDFIENIVTISAGITQLEVLDEKWNGEIFWMKAAITIDRKQLEKSLKQVIADRQKMKELETLRQKLNDAIKEINQLKEAESKKQLNDQKENIDYTSQLLQLIEVQAEYEKEVETNTFGASDYYNKGKSKYLLADYSVAIDYFTKAIHLDVKYKDAYYFRGLARYQLEDAHESIVDFTQALDIDPTYTWAVYSRGLAKLNLINDLNGSIVDFSKAIEIDANFAFAFCYRGLAKSKLKDYNGSMMDYSKSIEINPKLAYAYYLRALTRIEMGNEELACFDLSKAEEFGFEKAQEAIKQHCL